MHLRNSNCDPTILNFSQLLALDTHFAMADAPTIFTKTSAYSLGGVVTVGLVAYISSTIFLPKNAKWQDRFTFIWLVNLIDFFISTNVPPY